MNSLINTIKKIYIKQPLYFVIEVIVNCLQPLLTSCPRGSMEIKRESPCGIISPTCGKVHQTNAKSEEKRKKRKDKNNDICKKW